MNNFSGKWHKVAIITDDNVNRLYAKRVREDISPFCKEVIIHSVPPKESSKSRLKKAEIEDRLTLEKFDRNCLVIALGGGMIGDLAGFVAATFLRGIEYINIPTTLLSMVDASIGGKCGINTRFGKNLIGALYFPSKVLVDVNFLKTLSDYDIKCGMAEIIKAALVAKKDLFDAISSNASLEELVRQSREIKESIVKADLNEQGKRRILNFGHTVAHCLEKLSYYKLSHGACVWFGLLLESKISQQKGFLSSDDYDLIKNLLFDKRYAFEESFSYTTKEMYDAMKFDKKCQNGNVRMCLIKRIGEAVDFEGQYCTTISEEELHQALLAIKESKVEV